MVSHYKLKAVEYLFYALACIAALPLLTPKIKVPLDQNDLSGLIFLLVGLGVVVPRAIAFSRWPIVIATVGPYSNTWDGEHSARYSYEFDNQRFSNSFRAMYGTAQRRRLKLCVNPRAPWVAYPVFVNVWCFGGTMLAVGLFLMISDYNFFG